jgi:NADPH-dependent glutamate synthase beta subunit-like oxidoreductase
VRQNVSEGEHERTHERNYVMEFLISLKAFCSSASMNEQQHTSISIIGERERKRNLLQFSFWLFKFTYKKIVNEIEVLLAGRCMRMNMREMDDGGERGGTVPIITGSKEREISAAVFNAAQE